MQDIAAQMNRAFKLAAKEFGVKGNFRRPRVEPNADFAPAVVQPEGDEIARMRDEIDDVAILGVAFDSVDRAGKNPGMHGEKWPRPLGFQFDTSVRHADKI